MKHTLAAACAALALLPGQLCAEDAEPLMAPKLPQQFQGQSLYGQIMLFASPDWSRLDDPAAPMRMVEAITPPERWFAPDSALITGYLAAPDKPFHAGAQIEVDATGRIASCTFQRAPTAPLDESELCLSLKERLMFRPALDQGGSPVAAKALVSISSTGMMAAADGTPPPLFRPAGMAPPAPPPPPPPPKLKSFPPEQAWMRFHSTPASYRLPLGSGAPPANGVVGLVYGAKGSPLAGCEVIAGSGDPARDAEACRWVEKKLRPAWGGDTPPGKRHAPLLVRMDAAEPVAFAADSSRAAAAKPVAGQERAFYDAIVAAVGEQPKDRDAALALRLLVDAGGKVSHCQIATSSGTNTGDVAACRIAREGQWFTSAIDVFGRPQAGGFRYWNGAFARHDLGL